MQINTTWAAKAAGVLCAGILASAGAFAAPVIDQVNDGAATVGFNGGSASLTWQQGVTAGQAGQLSAIEVFFSPSGLSQGIEFFVNKGAAWQSDPHDFSTTLTNLVSGWNLIDVSAAGLTLSVGEQFVFGFKGLGNTFTPSFTGTTGNAYAAGQVFLNGNAYVADYDVNFRTHVEAGNRLPEPASVALVAMACLGAGLARRRARA